MCVCVCVCVCVYIYHELSKVSLQWIYIVMY
jgi:hypothetical protein